MDDCFCFNAPDMELRKDIRAVLKKHNVFLNSETDNIRTALLIAYSIIGTSLESENDDD